MWSRLRQVVKFQSLVVLALSAICSLAVAQEPAAPQIPVPLEDQLADFRQLRRTQASLRTCVARLHAIGRLGTDQAVESLVKMVPQLDGGLQMAAVHAIYLANSNYANEQLQRLTNHRRSDAVRRQACRDLLLTGNEHRVFLRDQCLAREKNLMIRGEILRGLLLHDVPHLEAEVLKAARSKDNIYASAGILGVGKLQLPRGRKFVQAAARSEDPPLRRDAFQALGLLGGVTSMEMLLEAYADSSNLMFRETIAAALRHANDEEELKVVIAHALDSKNIELVRIATGVVALAAPRFPDFCNPPLFKLLEHEDQQVTSQALFGLVASGSEEIVATLITRLGQADPETSSDALWALQKLNAIPAQLEARIVDLAANSNSAARLQAALSLRRFPDSERAFQAVYQLLKDKEWVVRSAAAESLAAFRRVESLPGLITLIEVDHGRVRDDSLECLSLLTGEDFGPLLDSWPLWLDNLPKDYQLPTAADANAMLEVRRQKNNDGQSVVASSYHGIRVPEGGVVFALDISESMSERFDAHQSYYEHYSAVLGETIANLHPQTKFGVVLFSNSAKTLDLELREASSENIAASQAFLEHAQPGGGTNLHAALLTAMALEETQSVFILSDGAPTLGRLTAPEAILHELEIINRHRRIRINTIAAGSAGAEFLAELAQASGGKAVDITSR